MVRPGRLISSGRKWTCPITHTQCRIPRYLIPIAPEKRGGLNGSKVSVFRIVVLPVPLSPSVIIDEMDARGVSFQ